MPRAQRVTGQDVADRAGVSRATVSYVLNDAAGQPISADTRARVLAAAAELGYTPHAAARQLRTGVSDLVLLAHPPWPNSHALSLCISAFTQRLGELGYTALVDPATQEVARLAHTLARLQPVALVASGELLTEPLVARLRSAGTRAVLGFGDRPLGLVPTVVFDQSAVTRVAMAHLARRGHRSVVAVMPADPAFEWFRAGRQAGAQEAADEHGMALTVVESPLDHDRIGAVVAGALAGPTHPDAVAGLQRRLRPPRAPGPRRRGRPRARRRRGDRVRQPARGRAVHPAPHHGRRRHECSGHARSPTGCTRSCAPARGPMSSRRRRRWSSCATPA